MDNYDEISTMDVGDTRYNEPLSLHTSWRIGGPADLFIEPHDEYQLQRIIRYSRAKKIPVLALGNGSNILVNDKGIRGIVINVGKKFSQISIDNHVITAGAGVSAPDLATIAAKQGLGGLEHVAGIPGTLGGLVYMNGGSRGHCIGENIKKVWILDDNAHSRVLTKEECSFSYRYSSLQEMNCIIYKIELECEAKPPSAILNEMQQILLERERKIPSDFPSCGSVFLSNPATASTIGPPGKLIDDAGLKGFRVGDAQVSLKHGNFIVNRGNARSAEVISLVQIIREKIYRITNHWLESEVKYIAPDGKIFPLHQVEK
jgi:UDP-N-acetylmuramate dehydrogenase